MSEVRSNELETGLSSSGDPVKGDTVVSSHREVKAFYALGRSVDWMLTRWGDLGIDSNSQNELGFVCPMKRIGHVTSSLGRYAFMSLPSSMG